MRAVRWGMQIENDSQRHDTVQKLIGREPLTVTVKGECMLPLIESDAQLQITPARFYWPGDVVVALSGSGQYLVHRVIGVYRTSSKLKVMTQADSASRHDAATEIGAILGKVTGGCCHPHVVSVPLTHRVKALKCFAIAIGTRSHMTIFGSH